MPRKSNNKNPVHDLYRGNLTWLPERTIYLTIHGSHSFGTNIEGSDLDVKGVCIPPKEYLFGFGQNFEQAEQNEPDLVVYSLQKFMNLAANANPNIIEVLFTDPSDWLYQTPAGEKLHEHRYLFLSKKARYSFSGYAIAQLKRMKTHRGWILNPPKGKPERSDFGLEEDNKVSASIQGAFDKLMEKDGAKFDSAIMELLGREKRYMNAYNHWKQYENWKKTRNPRRATNEIKAGYCTKNAYHLVRLMRMCKEILTTGEVIVKRPDAKELLDIRNGKKSYNWLINWASEQDKEMEELYKSCTILPHAPDRKALDKLCIELTEESFS